MNHEQWTQLQSATKGHTPGPWAVSGVRNADIIADDSVLWYEGWANEGDITLTAAAPDLLAEVERLRGWIAFFQRESPTARLVLCADAALTGAEVPK